MNLRQIEAFRTVMLTGSVTAAAEQLGLTQPTISKLIAQLERSAKLKLFDRNRGGRLVPRREAHALLRDVERVMEALEEVGRSARHLARSHVGHIRIAAIPSLGLSFLPKAIAGFLATRPQAGVTLIVREASYVHEWVAAQTMDVGFVTDDFPPGRGTVASLFPTRARAVCVLPDGHPLARRKVLHAKDFADERFVSMGREPTFRALIERAFAEARVARKVTVETNHFAAACIMVAQGLGVSVVDPYSALACHGLGGIVLRPFEPKIPFVVNVLKAVKRPVPLMVEEFLAYLARYQETTDRRIRELTARGAAK
jgi:DNA-binding transcriptional LysR family regulator